MEESRLTPPPVPPPVQQSSSTINCAWCNKPMDGAVVNCPNCGRLRKDIYNNKVKSYVLCIPAGLLIGFSFRFFGGSRNDNLFDYYNNAGHSSNSTTGIIMVVTGILLGIAGTYFYLKASRQMKKWWWV